MHFDHELDTRGLQCPLPIVKTRAAMAGLEPGEVLKVISTDAGSAHDMPAFAQVTRHTLEASQVNGGEYVYFLRKRDA